MTRVASRSITTCPSWTGAPARCQTRSRAAARAARDRRERGVGVLRPGVAISRDTVGSEATGPNTPGWARSTAMSQAASPPSATATARSSHDLARVVRRQRHAATARASRDSCPGQPAAPGGLDQQHPTGVRHQRLAAGDHGQPGTTSPYPSPAECLSARFDRGLDNHDQTVLSRHFAHPGPACHLQDQPGESPRLARAPGNAAAHASSRPRIGGAGLMAQRGCSRHVSGTCLGGVAFETAVRIQRPPRQVMPPSQQVPSRWTASITALVRARRRTGRAPGGARRRYRARPRLPREAAAVTPLPARDQLRCSAGRPFSMTNDARVSTGAPGRETYGTTRKSARIALSSTCALR